MSWLLGCADKLAARCTQPCWRTLGLRTDAVGCVEPISMTLALLSDIEFQLYCKRNCPYLNSALTVKTLLVHREFCACKTCQNRNRQFFFLGTPVA